MLLSSEESHARSPMQSYSSEESEKLRRSKLIKLHCHAMDHLLEVQGNAEKTGKKLDTDFLFSQSFFMGIIGGIVLEKCSNLGLTPV